jgi:bud emergence protein 1
MVYGVVMYDFHAERGDELEAKAGEAIIVIAQSNPEWFVAKPIGRLGGPGLIPVSFVEIRDMASNTPVANPQEAVRKAGIPKVEEWKKMAADYKNSSITLGKFETGAPQQQIEQGMERMSIQQLNGRVSQGSGSNMVSLFPDFPVLRSLV